MNMNLSCFNDFDLYHANRDEEQFLNTHFDLFFTFSLSLTGLHLTLFHIRNGFLLFALLVNRFKPVRWPDVAHSFVACILVSKLLPYNYM